MKTTISDIAREEFDKKRIITLFERGLNIAYISQNTGRDQEDVAEYIAQYVGIQNMSKRPFKKTCALCKRSFSSLLPNKQSCLRCEKQWVREQSKRKNRKLKHAAYEVLGFRCAFFPLYRCCTGEKDERFLRVHGKKQFEQTNDLYLWIKDHPEEAREQYKLICFNANVIINKYNTRTLIDYEGKPEIEREFFLLHEL